MRSLRCFVFPRVTLLASTLAIVLATQVEAQIGAITEALGGRHAGENVYQRAPVLTESGYCLDKGDFSLAGYFLLGSLSEDQVVPLDDPPGRWSTDRVERKITGTRLFVSALYGLFDRCTIGVVGYPYLRFEWDDSGTHYDWDWRDRTETGIGDLLLYSKVSIWRSKKGWSGVSLIGDLNLPTGDEEVGAGRSAVSGGLAASHKIRRWIFHADASGEFPLEEKENAFGEKAEPVVSFAGAAVFDAHPRLGVALEGLGSYTDGDFIFDMAPGARFRVGKGFFLDGTFVLNLTSPAFAQFDTQFVVGSSVIF